jgi:hypothetical protein
LEERVASWHGLWTLSYSEDAKERDMHRRVSIGSILSLVLIVSGFAFPRLAAAEDSEIDAAKDDFAGIYTSKNGVKKERKAINKVIEAVVDDMSFVKRPFARSALKDSTKPCPTLELAFSGDQITIYCKTRSPIRSPLVGTAVDWTNEDGDPHRVSQKLEKGRIVQVFRGEDGSRKNVYTLQKGGKELKLEVTITSDDLPRALTYTRVFRRK